MLAELDNLKDDFDAGLAGADSAEALDRLRVEYLGRKGKIGEVMKRLPTLSADERPAVGKRANALKREMEQALKTRGETLALAPAAKRTSAVDLTLPGVPLRLGHRHPITRTRDEMIGIFQRLGFDVAHGPEVEDAYHNFETLNIPAEHPARDDGDNFYITDDVLMRTQTSPGQIRVMERQKPPIRVVVPGRVYAEGLHALDNQAQGAEATFVLEKRPHRHGARHRVGRRRARGERRGSCRVSRGPA